ncbi:anthranilate synthase component I [Haematospirillum jordaniae]|uniref:Anthranilate synthase component 1 n=1 Tax=Haematospirillum jordaniae TaxID=1549855 RepID=A0A143DET4_9PROT|nr:anthranilate synthase component I [Haematospirillum jordaniae]AMW35272.1 anthranilate synthase [Haematospirillum jordaniae]NKD45828.1 anthranilate synthase component I [Haematospirillum jordaniae]NKD56321.1 anthranilate synthase component I [Haematospirillum jordaniae]NKD58379.1 anthranilate synthase component I [Haematospirillum jordaniae]NKD66452.1 anthranilate synthase component I [Haematospirillum jordaniae]
MQTNVSFQTFESSWKAGKAQVLWRSISADMDSPLSVFIKLKQSDPLAFIMESVEGGTIRGRYTFMGLNPDLVWRSLSGSAEVNRTVNLDPNGFTHDGEAMGSLRRLIEESHIDLPDHLPPMSAGLAGYMGYDMVRLAEKLPKPNPDTIGIPDSLFIRPTIMAILDNARDILTIITPVRPNGAMSAEHAFEAAVGRINEAIARLQKPATETTAAWKEDLPANNRPLAPSSNTTREQFRGMVERAKEYIANGDVFQVVLSQRFRIPLKASPLSFYRALRRTNPSPFLFFFDQGEFSLVGSSPEILVRLHDKTVTVRPLAGTRKRGATPEEDKQLEEDLLADTKEISEHLMLLDLGRNDVGRVARPGTVRVTQKMSVERYSHVMHIVSNVEGQIADNHDAIAALMAGFPAGTVSGAPKVRAMEIIDELESEKRSFYAGSFCYISANGQLDTCITLRTGLIKNGELIIQAGAGIVADSNPDSEYEECINKAMALVRSAQTAEESLSKVEDKACI